ncbi:PC4-domain-containing protein [Gloeophyllum trabeum ATCC 11539]|uniref:PC4-domain-containing protein n=1 Tax=Gloeophyllum trabeum (strain ATCC 11539 / FP-39264 / Madison 617) TaxID=670483 RepID=S7RW59_GLOTA|nr:PC4-domain-containing protein [Gloeophyllum trabeum ATCC 11539]EPQ57524.1 PC4-domain-containing protein [Gloeophyllum trabeum ATCC 11539]
MAKRKVASPSEDENEQEYSKSESSSEEEAKPLAKRAKPSKYAPARKCKKADPESSGGQDDDEGDEVQVHMTKDGEQYVDLGKKKRATVRSFKGQVYVDIREFYGEDGDEKPGKKGVSLNLEQWETLKKSIETIDRLSRQQPSKRKK